MSKFTNETIEDLANKLYIGLTEEENKMVTEEFEVIDSNINLICEIDNIQNVKPMTHALDDFVFELREDEDEDSIPVDDALKNCDDTEGREVSVPKVVG